MLRRAYLSVIRRKTKTTILFLFLLIISTLVLSTISIKNATKKSMEVARKSLATEVTLSMDMSKLRDSFKNGDNASMSDKKEMMENMHDKMSDNSPKMSDVNKLKKSKYVVDVKYSFSVNASEEDFELYSTDSDDNNENSFMGGTMPMNRNNSLEVEAINTFKLLDEYQNKTITLESGEAFDEDDKDAVIISYELATTNDLKVGDTITVKDSSDKSHKLTIKGIYQNSETKGFNISYNKIYINASTAEGFMTEDEYNDGNYTLKSAVFYLDDPENSNKFISESKNIITDLEDRNLTLDIDTRTYEQMTSSIQNVAKLSTVILVIVIIAAIVVISLITINSLKDRNYELGVLLGLGEKKIKIVSQFIAEIALLATISFVCAIFSSKLISQKLADTIITSQQQTEEKMVIGPGMDRGNGIKAMTNVNEIKNVDVNVSTKDIGYLFIVGYGIIIISNIVPSVKIINSDPKDILSRKE